MRTAHTTEHDLWEDLRGKGITDLKQVAEARLERSGQLSVTKAAQAPKVVEVNVSRGCPDRADRDRWLEPLGRAVLLVF